MIIKIYQKNSIMYINSLAGFFISLMFKYNLEISVKLSTVRTVWQGERKAYSGRNSNSQKGLQGRVGSDHSCQFSKVLNIFQFEVNDFI